MSLDSERGGDSGNLTAIAITLIGAEILHFEKCKQSATGTGNDSLITLNFRIFQVILTYPYSVRLGESNDIKMSSVALTERWQIAF
jgi:hypothetical protein